MTVVKLTETESSANMVKWRCTEKGSVVLEMIYDWYILAGLFARSSPGFTNLWGKTLLLIFVSFFFLLFILVFICILISVFLYFLFFLFIHSHVNARLTELTFSEGKNPFHQPQRSHCSKCVNDCTICVFLLQ